MDILHPEHAQTKGRVIDPSFIYITNTVNKNLTRVRDRLWQSAKFVPHEHLLVKLLFGLGLTRSLSVDELSYLCTDRMYHLANSLNLTAATNYGKAHFNVTLRGDAEIILLTNEDYAPAPWQQLQPIKFLYHGHTNLNFQLGTNVPSDVPAYITINMAMLAYQYIEWSKWVRMNNVAEDVYQYLFKYALYNSIESYMDISLFNRHYFKLTGTPIPPDEVYREIPLPNLDNIIQRSNQQINQALMAGHRAIAQILRYTPCFFQSDALALTHKPKIVPTRQCTWVTDYFRLPYLHYGLLVGDIAGYRLDSGRLSTLQRELQALDNTRSLERLPKQISSHIIAQHFDPIMVLLSNG